MNRESKKHVVLFGGAFNPPHIGHLIVIQQAFEMIADIGELWLLPDNVSYFGKELAPAEHRLAMTKLLLAELPADLQAKIRVETILIDENLTGETYENLKTLKTSYPSHSFSFLMGSDNVVDFEKWSHWQDLPKIMHFYIYPRNGHTPDKLYENMTMLESNTQVITNFSSTIMRRRVQGNLSLQNFIPSSILDYVKSHKLYLPTKA